LHPCRAWRQDDASESERENDRSRQSMRVGHVVEVERIGLSEPGIDAQLLDAQEHEDRPDHVQPLHGDEPDPQGHSPSCPLNGERDTVVADKHGLHLQRLGGSGRAHGGSTSGCVRPRRPQSRSAGWQASIELCACLSCLEGQVRRNISSASLNTRACDTFSPCGAVELLTEEVAHRRLPCSTSG
jgi:hypothetical protein